METTTEKLNIYQKLLTIQKRVNGLGKDKKAFSYSYTTGDKVLSELKPMINDLGLLLKQEVLSIENVRQDYATKNGNKSEILSKVMMKFTWVDSETGEKDENLFGANGQNDFDKGVGSALTYAERYFLLKYFHIATDQDDIDNEKRKDEEKLAGPIPPAPLPNVAKTEPLAPVELPWITAATKDQRDGMIAFLAEGKGIDVIKGKYKMRPEDEAKLLADVKEHKANQAKQLVKA